MIFSTKEELIAQAEKDGACPDGLLWAIQQDSLEDILKNIALGCRLWCINQGYDQFSELCDIVKFEGFHWRYLLSKPPQFTELYDLRKLDGEAWCYLLAEQPQLAEYCDWTKLSDHDWYYLLELQPELEKYRKIKK
jgi:hypothetical protein